MKQLIGIKARHLQPEDMIFDYKNRTVEKIEYATLENAEGERYDSLLTMKEPENVHVSYGMEADRADNFKPNETVMILIDTDKIEEVSQIDPYSAEDEEI